MKAPFPWFGGKSRAAPIVWERFGDVANYVEPFAGSLAVLLARPSAPKIETVNDVDALLANFWRSLALSPAETARHADWPVNETDLHARHRWLVDRKPEVRAMLAQDPEAHDPKLAGWWVWGLCAWIGSGWCAAEPGETPRRQRVDAAGSTDGRAGKPAKNRGKGVHAIARQLPDIGARSDVGGVQGRGVIALSQQLPHLGGTGMDSGRGVHARALSQQAPHLGNAGMDAHSSVARSAITATFDALSARLRHVRVACGDFERILSDSVTWRHGTTGILLDPPYLDGDKVYAADVGEGEAHVGRRAYAWAEAHGSDKRLRIAVCYYDGTWAPPSAWAVVPWKAKGGYAGQSAEENVNAARERIAFSPGCLSARQGNLFAGLGVTA